MRLNVAGRNENFNSHSDVRLAGVALLSKRAQGGTGKLIEGVKRGVQGPWDFVRRCCFLSLGLALAACSNLPGSFEVTPFLHEQITGDTWRACLAREYQLQARLEVRSGRHWNTAIRLSDKGRAALDRQPIEPEPSTARPLLNAALTNRDRNPCECAKAQARFDAWAIQEGRGVDTSAAHKAFDEALPACTSPR